MQANQRFLEAQVSKTVTALAVMAKQPKQPKLLTLRETVEMLRPKILLALQHGYTHKDIVETMREYDIQISTRTLGRYLKMATNMVEATVEATVEAEALTAKPAQPAQMEPDCKNLQSATSSESKPQAVKPADAKPAARRSVSKPAAAKRKQRTVIARGS